jgi:hypothetical protein
MGCETGLPAVWIALTGTRHPLAAPAVWTLGMGAVMKLLLRRDQRVSRLGKMQFVVDVRAQLNKDEQRSIQTHRFGKAVLYVKNGHADRAKGLPG